MSSLQRTASWPPNIANRSSFVSSDDAQRPETADRDATIAHRLGGYRFENAAATYAQASTTATIQNKRWGLQPVARASAPPIDDDGRGDPSSSSLTAVSADTPHRRPPSLVIDTRSGNVVAAPLNSASFLAMSSPAQSTIASLSGSRIGSGSVVSSIDSPLFSHDQPPPMPPAHVPAATQTPSKPARMPPVPPPSTAPGILEGDADVDGPETAAAAGPAPSAAPPLSRPLSSSSSPPPPVSNSGSPLHRRRRRSRRPASSQGSGEHPPFLVHLPRSSSLRSTQLSPLGDPANATPPIRTTSSSSSSMGSYFPESSYDKGGGVGGGGEGGAALSNDSALGLTTTTSLSATKPAPASTAPSGMTSSVSRLAAMFGGQLPQARTGSTSGSKGPPDDSGDGDGGDGGDDKDAAARSRPQPSNARRGSEKSIYEDAKSTLEVPEVPSMPSMAPPPPMSPNPDGSRPMLPAKSPLRPNREWASRPATASLSSHGNHPPADIHHRRPIATGSASTLGHGHPSEEDDARAPRFRQPQRRSVDDLELDRIQSPLRPSIERAAVLNGAIPFSSSAGSIVDAASGLPREDSASTIAGGDRVRSTSSNGLGQGLLEPLPIAAAAGDPQQRERAASHGYVPPLGKTKEEGDDGDASVDGDVEPPSPTSKMKTSTSFGKTMKRAAASPGAGIASAFKPRKFSMGAKDAEKMGKRWRFGGKDVLSDTEEDAFGVSRTTKRSTRKKAGEPMPRLEIRRVFDTPPLEGQASAESSPLHDLAGDMSRRRMPSGRSAMPLHQKASTASFASALSGDSYLQGGAGPLPQPPSSAAAAASWTKDDLDEEGKRVYKRRNIIRELVHTEQSYASDLAVIRDVYLAAARQRAGVPPNLALWSTVTGISPSLSPAAYVHSTSPVSMFAREREPFVGTATPSSGVQHPAVVGGAGGLNSAFASPALSTQPSLGGADRSSTASTSGGGGVFPNVTESNRSSVWTSNSVGTGSKSDVDSASMSNVDLDGKRAEPVNPAGPTLSRVSMARNNASTPPPFPPPLSTRPTLALDSRIPSYGSASSASGRFDSSVASSAPFTVSEMRTVFAGVEACAAFATELSLILEASMGSMSSQALPADPRDLKDTQDDRIGQALCGVATRIRNVYSAYCSKHEASIAKLQQLSKSSRTADFLKECTDVARRYTNAWDLASLLIKPVQRMLKYPLLLQEVVAATSPTHPDYASLTTAVEEMQAIADFINELNRRRDIIKQIVSGGSGSAGGSAASASSSSGGGKLAGAKTLRKKAGTKSRERLQPSLFTGGLATTASSNAANLEDDDVYLSLVSAFATLERDIPAFSMRCMDWCQSAKEFQVQQMKLLRQWIQVYTFAMAGGSSGGDASSDGDDSVAAESQALQAFARLLEKAGERVCVDTEKEIRRTVLPALSQIMPIFDSPRAYIMKRLERQEDYNKCRTASGKVLDRKLIESANGFVALHSQLLDELPTFLYGVRTTLDIVIAKFAHIQALHSKGVKDAFESSFNQLRAEGDANRSSGSAADPNVSIASTSTTISTTSAREVIQGWWNAHQAVAAQVEGLAMCSRDASARKRSLSTPAGADATAAASPSASAAGGHPSPALPAKGRDSLNGGGGGHTAYSDGTRAPDSPVASSNASGRKSSFAVADADGAASAAASLQHAPVSSLPHSVTSTPHKSSIRLGSRGGGSGNGSVEGGLAPGHAPILRSVSGGVMLPGAGAAADAGSHHPNGLLLERELPTRRSVSQGSTAAASSSSSHQHQQRVLPTPPMLPTLDLGEEDLSPQVSMDHLPTKGEQR